MISLGRSTIRPDLLAVVLLSVVLMVIPACTTDAERDGPGAGPNLGPTPGPDGGASSEGTSDAVRLRAVASVDTPVALAPRPGTSDLYVAEQGGIVRRISTSGEGTDRAYDVSDTPALDLRDETRAQGEQGLLGLAFSPDGRYLYTNHTGRDGATNIVEYAMDGDRADDSSARSVLVVGQPYPNHNGGQLAFGPDGYLYIALGDGGSSNDPDRRAQDIDDLLGKILRIDPLAARTDEGTGATAYAIPPGNPYASGGGRPEIWISGARNPWRFSFDPETEDLWVADVGQNGYEEINFLPAQPGGAGQGANLGWPYYEGTAAHLDTPPAAATFVEPVSTYSHDGGACSISGGYVYRGIALPALVGSYLFGDYCTAEITALHEAGDGSWTAKSLGVSVAANSLSSFGQDLDGEIYVLSTEGSIYRIDPA